METQTSRGPLLAVLFFGVLMAALDIAMLGPAKPAIQETFAVDERGGLWILNAFVLFNLMGVPVMSKLADLFGRRKIFLAVVFLFGAGSMIVAMSTSYGMLLAGRAIQGLSVSGIFPVAAAVIGDVYEPEFRGRALGVLGAVFGVAFVVGPIFAGIILPYGWRLIYFSYLPLAGIIWFAAYRRIPAVVRERSTPLDVAGVLTLSAALLCLTYGISQLDPAKLSASIRSMHVWPPVLFAAVLLPIFYIIERNAPDPVIRLSMFKNRQIVLSGAIAVGAGVVEAAFISFPTLAGLSMGVDLRTASFMLIPLSLAIAFGSPLAGRLLDRIGSRSIVLMSNSALVLGMVGISVWPASRLAFFVSTILIGLGLAGNMGSALSYILLQEAREEDRTASQGLITLFISVGQLLGAAFVGAVVASLNQSVAGYSTAFLWIAAVLTIITLFALRLKRRSEESARF